MDTRACQLIILDPVRSHLARACFSDRCVITALPARPRANAGESVLASDVIGVVRAGLCEHHYL